ncbi:MAG: hypothetical protein ACI8XO_002867 [Verrucomicrobiales bacterium]|jgi:hypothetical protein
MWRPRLFFVLLICGVLELSAALDDPETARFERYSGRELTRLLTDDSQRRRAFYELCRREKPRKVQAFEKFRDEYGRSEVVVCPQPGRPNEPIFVFLYEGIVMCFSVWAGDLRSLKSRLSEIATHRVGEYEHGRAHSYGPEVFVEGRFHLARQILAMWSEPDAETRARLLVAFIANRSYEFTDGSRLEALVRVKQTLKRLTAELSDTEKANVVAMAERMLGSPASSVGRLDRKECERIVELLRAGLAS